MIKVDDKLFNPCLGEEIEVVAIRSNTDWDYKIVGTSNIVKATRSLTFYENLHVDEIDESSDAITGCGDK